MMLQILNQYIEDNMQVTEYTKDGTTISHVEKIAIPTEIEIIEQPTAEEQILFETKYQTLLLETMALGGTN